MQFNDHSKLAGKHAFMSASKSSWLNYDDDTFKERFLTQSSTTIGELLHKLAAKMIKERIPLKKSDKTTIAVWLLMNGIPRYLIDPDKWVVNLSNYINDAIRFGMEPEVILYYSDYCFGTTDSILYTDRSLRIHDLKTGTTPVHIEQLLIYAALYCHEYMINPKSIETELRIYQNGEVIFHKPDPEEIQDIMDVIESRDRFIEEKILKKYHK